jgi:hypothetical protein
VGTLAETAIVDYRLSFVDQENKLPSSVLVFRKQREVGRFSFPFAANKRLLLFSVSSAFRLQNCGDMEMEALRHGDIETLRHGVMETWRNGDIKT